MYSKIIDIGTFDCMIPYPIYLTEWRLSVISQQKYSAILRAARSELACRVRRKQPWRLGYLTLPRRTGGIRYGSRGTLQRAEIRSPTLLLC